MKPATAPAPDPAAIWEWITKTDAYTDWRHWPDHYGFQPGAAPHGPRNKIFVNDIMYQTEKIPIAAGGMAVKENYSIGKELTAYTVMLKVPGYNPDGNDWYWVKYSPGGVVEDLRKARRLRQLPFFHGRQRLRHGPFLRRRGVNTGRAWRTERGKNLKNGPFQRKSEEYLNFVILIPAAPDATTFGFCGHFHVFDQLDQDSIL